MTLEPPIEGKCDKVVRLVNESGVYPDHRAFRASDAGQIYLVLLRHKQTGEVTQIEWSEVLKDSE
jgi:hypothetical protein